MNNFLIIYRILSALRDTMSEDEFDESEISAAAVGANDNLWASILRMLAEGGYIKNVSVKRAADGVFEVTMNDPAITLKGLEYLQTSQLMQTASMIEKAIQN